MDSDVVRLRRLFEDAIQLPAAERQALLEARCAGQPELRQQVEALIATAESSDRFLCAPTAAAASGDSHTVATRLATPLAERPGTKIGPYKLLQQIGEGGFGVVFMAEQERPVVRRVAMKVIKLGMDTRAVVARFEAERQALAMMDHPNIARVLDAGATETGRPYFVMELVRGDPITHYCDTNNLSTRDRLELFVQVCHAVQHAHQKGIIHRDIKPSNALVTVADGRPIPKVIDFGIAKATASKLTEKTLFTEHRALIGTPAYMSPEQAEMSGVDIDTRSDIYSLGVLLYELLTGCLPFDSATLRGAAYADVRRIIREIDPPRPSTRLSSLGANLADDIVKRRSTAVHSLRAELKRELEWIPLKAIRKDRTERYATVRELAQDLQRYLDNKPLMAAPPSKQYLLRKFVKRNRGAVATASVVAASLVLGIVTTSWQLSRAKRAEAIATAQREEALHQQSANAETTQFLLQLFSAADPYSKADPNATAIELVRRGVHNLDRGIGRQPLVKAQVQEALGTVLHSLSDYPESERLLREALGTRSKLLGSDDRRTLALSVALARVMRTSGNREAIPLACDTYERCVHSLGARDPLTFEALNELAVASEAFGETDVAATLYERSFRESPIALGADHEHALVAANNWVRVLRLRGDLQGAESLAREVLAAYERTTPTDHPQAIAAADALCNILASAGKLDEAEKIAASVFAKRQQVLGADHVLSNSSRMTMGQFAMQRLRFAEGATLIREAHEGFQKSFKPDHPVVVSSGLYLAVSLLLAGKVDEAEVVANRWLLPGLRLPNTSLAEGLLSLIPQRYELAGRPGDAARWRQEAARLRATTQATTKATDLTTRPTSAQ